MQRQLHRIAAPSRVSSGQEVSTPKKAEGMRSPEIPLKLTGFTRTRAHAHTRTEVL